MFKLTDQATVKWPVRVQIPRDGGRSTQATFSAEFRLLPQEEVQRLVDAGAENTDNTLLREAVVDWADVADESGEPLEFTTDNLDRMLRVTYVRVAMVAAFFEAQTGGRRKN